MFDNIGSKIKTLARVLCWTGIMLCIITGFFLMISDDDFILIGILTAVAGSVLSWVSSFLLYGFGQLVENSDIIANRSYLKKEPSALADDSNITSNDTIVVKNEIKKCEMCSTESTDIINCKIVDNLGTRYRKLCPDCQSKYNATPIK